LDHPYQSKVESKNELVPFHIWSSVYSKLFEKQKISDDILMIVSKALQKLRTNNFSPGFNE